MNAVSPAQAPTSAQSNTVGAIIGAPVDVTVGTKQSVSVDRSAATIFENAAGPTATEIAKNFKADRAGRAASIIDAVTGGDTPAAEGAEGADASEAPAAEAAADTEAPTPAAVSEQEGASEGADATKEQTRLERIEAAIKRSKGAARFRREQNEALARARSESSAKDAQLAEARRVASRVQSVEQALRDPTQALGLLKQLGMTPEQLAHHVLQENTPEAKIAAEAARLAEVKAELKAIKDQMAAKEAAADLAQRKSAFIKRAGNAEKYPNLVGQPEHALITLGMDVANRARAKYPIEQITDHAILVTLDRMYGKAKPKAAASAASAASAAPGKKAPVTAKAAPTQSGSSKPKPEPPRTLTNGQSSGGFSKPDGFDKLSRSERISRMRAGYSGR